MNPERTIDVHGLTVEMAKREIEKFIAACPQDVKRVIVIHGYFHGDALRDFIQSKNGIRSNRVRTKKYTKNRGETIFELY